MPEVENAENLRCLTATNPGYMTLRGTNQYLLGRREITVIDVALGSDANVDGLLAEMEALGGHPHHPDPAHAHPYGPLWRRAGAETAHGRGGRHLAGARGPSRRRGLHLRGGRPHRVRRRRARGGVHPGARGRALLLLRAREEDPLLRGPHPGQGHHGGAGGRREHAPLHGVPGETPVAGHSPAASGARAVRDRPPWPRSGNTSTTG